MSFDPYEINFSRELSYNHPYTNSTLFYYLLSALLQQQRSPRTRDTFQKSYDYVIVGGGQAGSVVASRLSEEQRATVLLLEYGEHPPIMSDFTALFALAWNTDIDYTYKTAPQKHTGFSLADNRVPFPRGKVLGGSSVINAMMYVRGNRRDFDDWSAMGAQGWSYEEVLPYFKKSENNSNPGYVASGYHGKGGPVSVSDQTYHEVYQAPVLEAAVKFGYKILDSNGAKQTGFFVEQGFTRDTQRCSAAKAYLVPAENRTNLDILTKAHVNRIIFDKKCEELTASHVEFELGGRIHRVRAEREVIMAAGSINTPQILMLSGVGPKEELKKHGIPLVKDLPVGKNLNDHPAAGVDYIMKSGIPSTEDKLTNMTNIFQYVVHRKGPLSSTASVAALAFLKDNEIYPAEDFPNFELLFFQMDVSIYKSLYGVASDIYDSFYKQYEGKQLLHCHVSLLQPKSLGSVTLNSANSYDDPIIDPNYLEHPDDIETMVQGLQACRKIMESDSVKEALGAEPIDPFPSCRQHAGDEAQYYRCFLKQFIATIYHPTTTTKMGDPQKNDTVVCPKLKVKDIKNLRVVDASVMPKVTSGHTGAAVYMIAEKAADMIKEDLYRGL